MPVFFVKNMRLMYGQKNCFFKKRELIYRPIFSINATDPVGDYTALPKRHMKNEVDILRLKTCCILF